MNVKDWTKGVIKQGEIDKYLVIREGFYQRGRDFSGIGTSKKSGKDTIGLSFLPPSIFRTCA